MVFGEHSHVTGFRTHTNQLVNIYLIQIQTKCKQQACGHLNFEFFKLFFHLDDEGDEDEDERPEPEKKKLKWEKGHDVNENKTVFVRNLSFNSDEEDLRDMMEENFGKVLFARFVIDR